MQDLSNDVSHEARKIPLSRRLQWQWRRLCNKLHIFWMNHFYFLMPKKSRSRSRRQLSPSELKLKKIKTWRIIALAFVGLVIVGIVGFIIMFAWFSRDLPQPGQVVRREGFSSKIYDRNGQLLYDLYEEERRNPVDIAEVPADLKNATVAIEDKDFYKHQGFDFLTILRIPYNLLVRRRVVGGSTLTQQLVKNALLTNERTIVRKFKELVLSIQIERKFSKDEILAMYLNEAPYGGNAWGVGTAVEIYFNKPLSELSLLESAFLAGLPQRPTAYSPYSGQTTEDGQPYWQIRTTSVLNAMKNNGYITELAYDEALADLNDLTFERAASEIKAPHFIFYVQQQLVDAFGEDVLNRGGLQVTTTLDWSLQDLAETVVADEVEAVEKYDISNGAALAIDPQTGEILAMVGSRDYFNSDIGGQFNVTVDALRQPGSAIKPITYLGMIQQGYTPATMIMDVETTFNHNDLEKPYTPKNYDGAFRGPVSVRQSLGSSLNIPAVKSLAMVGLNNFLNLAYTMGLETLEPTPENLQRYGLAVTLGGAEVHMIDLAEAYSSFANGGYKVEPVSILKVEDSEGHVLFEHHQVAGKQIIDSGEAFLINNILSDNNARLLAFGANSLLNTGRPIAVKTGTTNEMKDNWTIGWSQDVLVATWVGNNDGTAMSYVASGITGASPIWRRIILGALDLGYEAPEWVMPDNVEQVEVDAISGYPKHDNFPSKFDYAIRGTLPSLPDPTHQLMRVCKGETDKLATEAKIAAADFDEKEFIVTTTTDPVSEDGINRWQLGVDAWVNAQEDSRYHYPTSYCGDSGDISVRLREPDDKENFDETKIIIEIRAGSDEGIDKLVLYVDGKEEREIKDQTEYKGEIELTAGKHELYVKAYGRNGKTKTSDTSRIGVGGVKWDQPDSTPTPSPSPSTTPSISISPSPSLSPSPSPSEAAD